jgi:hypothetical protein
MTLAAGLRHWRHEEYCEEDIQGNLSRKNRAKTLRAKSKKRRKELDLKFEGGK